MQFILAEHSLMVLCKCMGYSSRPRHLRCLFVGHTARTSIREREALPGAAALICAQPLTASDVAYRKSQLPGAGGGATRSLRLAIALSQPGRRQFRQWSPVAR